MDAYHAPYKKETRYWTGLFLLVRCALFLTFALNAFGNVNVNLLVITSITVSHAVLAWTHGRVYENLYNDILEGSFVLNLCIFAAATYHVMESGGSQAGLAYTAVGIAFIAFIFIVLYHIYLCLHETSSWKKLPKPTYFRFGQSSDNEEWQPDDAVQAPTTSSVELRESLLEK